MTSVEHRIRLHINFLEIDVFNSQTIALPLNEQSLATAHMLVKFRMAGFTHLLEHKGELSGFSGIGTIFPMW